jgi:prepilin-type N-terminal cleavage/methylation domain-containing protein
VRRAFSLFELSAVLALIGLLSAAAVPSLSRMVARGRASEARALVETIAHAELRYFRDHGGYLAAPATPPAPPTATTTTFSASAPWQALGVVVNGPVAYSYDVVVADGSFVVTARGDLVGDGVRGRYVIEGKTLQLTVDGPLE